MSYKLCCDCGHMDHEWGAYSDSCERLLCRKGHFDEAVSVAMIRENIRRAATCPDYTAEPQERPTRTVYTLPIVGWIDR